MLKTVMNRLRQALITAQDALESDQVADPPVTTLPDLGATLMALTALAETGQMLLGQRTLDWIETMADPTLVTMRDELTEQLDRIWVFHLGVLYESADLAGRQALRDRLAAEVEVRWNRAARAREEEGLDWDVRGEIGALLYRLRQTRGPLPTGEFLRLTARANSLLIHVSHSAAAVLYPDLHQDWDGLPPDQRPYPAGPCLTTP